MSKHERPDDSPISASKRPKGEDADMTEEPDKSTPTFQDAQFVPVAMSLGGSTVPSLLQQSLPQELLARSAVSVEQQTTIFSVSPSNSSSFTFVETTETLQSGAPQRTTVQQQRKQASQATLAGSKPKVDEEEDFELIHDGSEESSPSLSTPPPASPISPSASTSTPSPSSTVPPAFTAPVEPIPAAPWGGLTVPYVCLLLIVFSVFLPYYQTSKAHSPVDILCNDYLFGSYCPFPNSDLPVYVMWRRTPLSFTLWNATQFKEPEAFLSVFETFTDRVPLIWILAGIVELFFVMPYLTTRATTSAWQAVPGFHFFGMAWLVYSAYTRAKPCALEQLSLGFYAGLLGQLLFWCWHGNLKSVLMLGLSFLGMTFLFDNYPASALTVFVVRLALCY